MKRFLPTFSLIFLFFFSINAQIPLGYYNDAAGLTGQPLQAALHGIIDEHTSVTYQSIWYYFQSTDKKSDGTVWDIYSDVPYGTQNYTYQFTSDQCPTGGQPTEGICYVREHSFPRSWFGGDVSPMWTDIFILYPTDSYVNGKRSNYPYGTVSSPTWTSMNGCKFGPCTADGYAGTVFEPIDEYKGDLARTYFYMSTRYYGMDGSWPGSDMTNGAQLKPWALKMMLQWNAQDPVSQKETDRNNAIYHIQSNRNPFIDHPEYANAIWATGAGIPEGYYTELSLYPNPATEYTSLSLPAEIKQNELHITVLSASGSQIRLKTSMNGDKLTFDLTSLPSGIYFVSLVTGNGNVYHGKIVK